MDLVAYLVGLWCTFGSLWLLDELGLTMQGAILLSASLYGTVRAMFF